MAVVAPSPAPVASRGAQCGSGEEARVPAPAPRRGRSARLFEVEGTVDRPEVAVRIEDEDLPHAVRLVHGPGEDRVPAFAGRRLGPIGVRVVQPELRPDPPRIVGREAAVERMVAIRVVGVEHPLRRAAAKHREVRIGVDRLDPEHLAGEGECARDVAHQEIDREAAKRSAILVRGHPRVALAELHPRFRRRAGGATRLYDRPHLLGAAEEDVAQRPARPLVEGERLGVEIPPRDRREMEVSVAVFSPHQRRAVPPARALPGAGRDVVHREPDPPVAGTVGAGGVGEPDVVQRRLPRREGHRNGLRFVDVHRDLLPPGEQVVVVVLVAVRQHRLEVAPRKHPHAAALLGGRRERHPGGDELRCVEPPVARVLMPGDEARAVRLLDPEDGVPAQKIGADEVLDRVEDPGMAHEVVHPLEQEVGLAALRPVDGPALRRFEPFEAGAMVRGLVRVEYVDGEVVSVSWILGFISH